MSNISFDNDQRIAFVFPVMQVDNTSTAASSISVGPPGPTAAAGFAHRIERDLRAEGILADDDGVEGVSIIVHSFEITEGHRRIPPETRDESNSRSGAMLDEPDGCLTCTLVVAMTIENAAMISVGREFLERNIRRYRFGGGRIVRSGISTADAGPTRAPAVIRVEAAKTQADFLKIVRTLPPGVALLDRTSLLDKLKEPTDDRDALDRLLDILAVKQRPVVGQADDAQAGVTPPDGAEDAAIPDPGEDTDEGGPEGTEKKAVPMEWFRESPGWLVPVNLGWRAISEVRQRDGVRSGDGIAGHVWAEDVVGLGEWVSLRKVFGKSGSQPSAFWSYQTAEAQGPYLVRAL